MRLGNNMTLNDCLIVFVAIVSGSIVGTCLVWITYYLITGHWHWQ